MKYLYPPPPEAGRGRAARRDQEARVANPRGGGAAVAVFACVIYTMYILCSNV